MLLALRVLFLVRLRRFERPPYGLGIRCSILLSYRRRVRSKRCSISFSKAERVNKNSLLFNHLNCVRRHVAAGGCPAGEFHAHGCAGVECPRAEQVPFSAVCSLVDVDGCGAGGVGDDVRRRCCVVGGGRPPSVNLISPRAWKRDRPLGDVAD